MNTLKIIRAYEDLKFYYDERYTRAEAYEELSSYLEYITEEQLNDLLSIYYFHLEDLENE